MNLGKDVGVYVIRNFMPLVVAEFKAVTTHQQVMENLVNSLYNLLEGSSMEVRDIEFADLNGDGEFVVIIDGEEYSL